MWLRFNEKKTADHFKTILNSRSGHVSSNPYPAFSVEAHNYHRYQECLIFAVINPRCGTLETEVIDWGGICRTPQLCTNMSLGIPTNSLLCSSFLLNVVFLTTKLPEFMNAGSLVQWVVLHLSSLICGCPLGSFWGFV